MSRTIIVILTWNRLEITLNTLKSLLKHNKNNMRDILFMDNGSTDGTVGYLEKQGYEVLKNSINEGIFMATRKVWLEGVRRGYDFILNLQNDFPCIARIPFDDMESYMDQNLDAGFIRLNKKKKKKNRYINYLKKVPIVNEPWVKVGSTYFSKHNHHFSFNPNLIRSSIIDHIVTPIEKPRERQLMERFEELADRKNMKAVEIKNPCSCFDTIIRPREEGWIH